MIVLGTRGSALALAQTDFVRTRLLSIFPASDIAIRVIKTSADHDMNKSIRAGSSVGVFVKELEQALLSGEIDLAVHSMKDVPTKTAAGLAIIAVPEREDAHDAFISTKAESLLDLPPGSIVGTGSVRRQAQILALRPDLKMRDIRGNIDTRLRKLMDGTVDALVLACAGLNRLGYQRRVTQQLDLKLMLPAPGQGALALQMRVGDPRAADIAAVLHHRPSFLSVQAERMFLQKMSGGCNVPVAAYATIAEDKLVHLEGLAAAPDGSRLIRESVTEDLTNVEMAADVLARRILDLGGREILAQIP